MRYPVRDFWGIFPDHPDRQIELDLQIWIQQPGLSVAWRIEPGIDDLRVKHPWLAPVRCSFLQISSRE